jgi:hypothetical protein
MDDKVRTFLESRFGHDFSGVRVHTDARAVAAADAVNARAFTAGSDIVFAAGQYAPLTRQGLRLLAHELTHVVQQRRATPSDPLFRSVGAAADPLEIEAAQVADQFEKGGPLPPIGADPAGVIRRVVRIVPGSGRLVDFRHNATTRIVHSFLISEFQFLSDTAAGEEAVSCRGQVTFSGDPGDTLDGWKVGFIQTKWITTDWAYYRGEKNADGSLFVQRARAPARVIQGCRDTEGEGTANQIWAEMDPVATPADVFPEGGNRRITVTTGEFSDSPRNFSKVVIENPLRKKPNYLRERQIEAHYCTVLSVQDPARKFHHMVSVYWNAHWQARFLPGDFTDLTKDWLVTPVNDIPSANGIHASHQIQGTPTDPKVTPFLTAPIAGGTNCNDLSKKSVRDQIVRPARTWADFDVRV